MAYGNGRQVPAGIVAAGRQPLGFASLSRAIIDGCQTALPNRLGGFFFEG